MATTRRTQRVRAETLRRREEILNAAMATFGSKGYHAGPLGEIADQVDMTHAGVLHHFGSKNQLLLEVLQHRDDTDVAELVEQRIPGGVEMFRHLVRTAFLNARRAGLVQTYAVLSAEAVTDEHPARAFFQDRYRTLRAEAVEAFEELCAERGVTATEAVRHASAAILAVMDGLQVQWLVDPERVDLGEASAYAIDAIVAAVVGPL
ncbi:TetR/AcrR family transcriptional regulator [Cellulosimicrobium arenosum]|uniref:TetR/AcrR family transcriptional regulator n=1 Tax=Cellulosimicrobium arenosum TaxID=2708133 RepID=A0A927J0P5_9MICO|nr:TetR/AcrR family transcriptional regulator [Cellulosimicrobium arenosum]MBD8079731.1 TetR/AcrR family transcriptional regulator [Cellulosimicrobium arenosum]